MRRLSVIGEYKNNQNKEHPPLGGRARNEAGCIPQPAFLIPAIYGILTLLKLVSGQGDIAQLIRAQRWQR
jgi:hypothetical protein